MTAAGKATTCVAVSQAAGVLKAISWAAQGCGDGTYRGPLTHDTPDELFETRLLSELVSIIDDVSDIPNRADHTIDTATAALIVPTLRAISSTVPTCLEDLLPDDSAAQPGWITVIELLAALTALTRVGLALWDNPDAPPATSINALEDLTRRYRQENKDLRRDNDQMQTLLGLTSVLTQSARSLNAEAAP